MANKEYTLSEKEKEELLKSSNKESYKMLGHQWVPMPYGGKMYCKHCGLVNLRNKATEWCIDKGCNYTDHPQYESAMKRLTKSQW